MPTRRMTGTATVKSDTKWIYAGHTFKILQKRDPSRFEMEFGAEYKLCLKGTEFESKYPTSPYTFIHAKDLIVNEDEVQLDDMLIDAAIEQIKTDINTGDISAIFELLRFSPVKNLIAFLPEEKQEIFGELKK